MEEWKDIPNYKGYQASSLGRIRTYDKTTFTNRHGIRHWKNRILKSKMQKRHSSNKYDLRVELWSNGKHKTHLVARLVACTFYNKPLDTELTVNHKNGNPSDNCISNLELITKKENIQHAFENGLIKNQIKIKLINKTDNSIFVINNLNKGNKIMNKSHNYLSEKIKKNIFENETYKWELF